MNLEFQGVLHSEEYSINATCQWKLVTAERW